MIVQRYLCVPTLRHLLDWPNTKHFSTFHEDKTTFPDLDIIWMHFLLRTSICLACHVKWLSSVTLNVTLFEQHSWKSTMRKQPIIYRWSYICQIIYWSIKLWTHDATEKSSVTEVLRLFSIYVIWGQMIQSTKPSVHLWCIFGKGTYLRTPCRKLKHVIRSPGFSRRKQICRKLSSREHEFRFNI